MGFSVSASIAIFLLGSLVMGSLAYTSMSNSARLVNDGQNEQHERMREELQTDINITSTDYNLTLQRLQVSVENTGSIVLDSSEVDLIIDGTISSSLSFSPSKVWIPENNLIITATGVSSSPNRVKVVTENGVSDYKAL
ncbi:MAG: hypothetical protein SVY15_04315 [Halobacteriota archaeon]|nr:hypothetical protein [Halobacteriota archaeon]MDY6958644.1 hypothetical protein [Halobacteriota archaeon]